MIDDTSVPVSLRLFLPEEWTAATARCARANVPEAAATPRSKGEIAFSELDRLRTEGVRFGVVLANAGYDASAALRQGFNARGLAWALRIARNQKVYDPRVWLLPPSGRPHDTDLEAEVAQMATQAALDVVSFALSIGVQ